MSTIKNESSKIEVSVIIPCYNEGHINLQKAINDICLVLDFSKLSYEIIMIDDYSVDDTVKQIKAIKNNNCKYYLHKKNIGRGGVVSEGILMSRGLVVGFIDIDLSTSPWYILQLISEIRSGSDVVIANRVYKINLKVLHRWILSKGYKFLVKILLNMDLGDTESGCKFFKREKIVSILPTIKDSRWFWDTEVVVRSSLKKYKISKIQTVFIRDNLHTSVKIFRDCWRHFINLIFLYFEIRKKR